MKYVLAILAAAVLAMPAAAQPQHQQPHPGGGHPAAHAPAMRAPATHAMRPASRPHGVSRNRTARHAFHGHTATRHAVHRHTRTHHAVRHVPRHAVHHAVRAAARPCHRVPRASIARLRRNIVAVHRFHAGPYRAPRGFVYRRWVFGDRLPGIYFASAFWITDFLAFDLFPPPDGYVWVRYGPDALLIDRYTGEIIQVQYGVFY